MTITYRNGRMRQCAAACWLVLLAWVAATWFGLTGIGCVCVAATRWYRAVMCGRVREFNVDACAMRSLWSAPWAVCVDSGAGPQWLCRDELAPGAWAQLLRWLYQTVPNQAVGFSISR